MKVFLLMELDFGSGYVVSVHSDIDSAQIKKANKESENIREWVSYQVEEWETE